MILDQDLNGQILAQKIRGYLSDRARLDQMAAAARALGRPDAAERIVDECYVLAHA
jgi:UDP-N-acetylglucosamine--N-acetylmuramyl-(pentapeptide) pyrophosphoryl-undecaprenol N-acetylglucosamine transferase